MRNKILSCINKAGYSHAGGVCLDKEQVEEAITAILQAIRDEVEGLRKEDKVYMCRLKMSRIIFNQVLDQIKEKLK